LKNDSSDKDILLQKVISGIAGKEREIVNDFCKAFIAQKSLEGFPISSLFDHFQFCVEHDFQESPGKSIYWFEPKVTYFNKT